ncbi:MAG: NERD domain-containing protein [Candidatus Nitronauta litoralis]|uniref:NERD domain-containing protein n=1 Tax=Candidatus Nitronauta litoralis TaxID=2705533 RepID=A0A7T0FYS5_9BACT|nr:MAG: NERD domain-containing protein [Candidatus Nitronauta litoralis]
MDPVSLLVLLAVGVGVWFFFFKGSRMRPPEAVRGLLNGLGGDYKVISGIIRMRGEGMDRIDHAVVSRFGVFIILEVTEPGALICRINSREWPRKGLGKEMALHNPVWRNRKRINSLEEILPGVPLFNLVVIVNARLQGERGPEVVLFDGLLSAIRKNQNPVLSAEQVEETCSKLNNL